MKPYREIKTRNYRASSKDLGKTRSNTINLHLEILNSCSFGCDGCFVRRQNSFEPGKMQRLKEVLDQAKFTDWNEVAFNPTDVFASTNFDDIFKDEWLRDNIVGRFTAISFNTTLRFPKNLIKQRVDTIQKMYPHIPLEFFIIVEFERFVSKDPEYFEFLRERISLLNSSNIIFTINIPEKFSYDFSEPARIANEYFDANFKYTPSFFRSSKPNIISKFLNEWNMNSTQNDPTLNYTYDPYFGGHTYTTLIFQDDGIFWAPSLIDYGYIRDERFAFKNWDDFSADKYTYLSGECVQCSHKIECSTKGIMHVKDFINSNECIMPKDFHFRPDVASSKAFQNIHNP